MPYSVLSAATVKDTTISFKVERALKSRLVAFAKAENRTLSNFIEKVLKEEIARRASRRRSAKTK